MQRRRRRTLVGLAISLAVVAVVGATLTVTGTTEPSAGAAESPSGSSAGARPGGTGLGGTARRALVGNSEVVTLALAGDASFQGLGSRLASDPASVLAAVTPTLSGADVAVVNLEAALGDGSTGGAAATKQFTFRVGPGALSALAAAGVDAVTVANNDGMDFGPAVLDQTLALRDQAAGRGWPAVLGAGRDAGDALAPHVVEVRGQRIGILAATDVLDAALTTSWTAAEAHPGLAVSKAGAGQERLLAAVADLRRQVDTVVVYLHMGAERDTCPTTRQRDLARELHRAGADVVVGSHAHRMQGAGFTPDGFVAYGLGNFVFGTTGEESARSGILEVRVRGSHVEGFDWVPVRISGGIPRPLTGEAADAAGAVLAERAGCAGLAESPR